LELDRSVKRPLVEQIRKGISAAIESGVLAPGARLPSRLDLAAQLGVTRGTIRSAYEKLSAAQLIVALRATGTHVADRLSVTARKEETPDAGSFMEMYQEFTGGPAIFQMGVPAQATFPAKLIARVRSSSVRAELSAPAIYPDPRGELRLRREIAAEPFQDDDQDFLGPLIRFAWRHEGPHRFAQKRPRTFVAALPSFAAVRASENQLSRDFRSGSIFKFCNSIDPKPTFGPRPIGVHSGASAPFPRNPR
jgi:DNA-binding transcriptional regulator YhcF (GntR family)